MNSWIRKTAVLFVYSLSVSSLAPLASGFAQSSAWMISNSSPVINNAGFETLGSGSEIPGWTYYWSPLTDEYSISVTDSKSYEGSYALKMVDGGPKSLGLISSSFPVTEGTSYVSSVKTWLEQGSVAMIVYYYDANHKEISNSRASISSVSSDWLELTHEGTAPAGAVTAKIMLYSGTAGHSTAYFDHMTVSASTENDVPVAFGDPIDLGAATKTVKTSGAAMANGEVYFATNGTPSTFYALDAATGQVLYSSPVQGVNTVYGVASGSDGNVYLSGVENGMLYRYSPTAKTLEPVGVNPSEKLVWDLAATTDGKIYGATYPNSKIFEYDIASNQFHDLGSVREDVMYARGIGVTDHYIYVGVGNPAYLYRIDRQTGEKSEVKLPNSGANDMIADVWSYNGKLFVRSGATTLFILDEETEEVLQSLPWPSPTRFDSMISPPSPLDRNLVYFRNVVNSELVTYNTATNEIIPLEGVVLPNSTVRAYDWVTPQTGNKAGKTLLAMVTEKLEYVLFDPEDQSVETIMPEIEAEGIDIQSLEMGPDGKLYMGGFHTALSIFDPKTNAYELQERVFPQIEGIGFLNDKVYFGTYGGAVIYRYDPTQPYKKDTNPSLAFNIEDGQSRPFAFAAGEDQLFIGTIADYGLVKGALTMYDEPTDTWTTIPDIVENQSVMSVAYKDGLVYGGTTIHGGGGSSPAASEAKMFIFDPKTKSKVKEFSPAIPGMASHQLIGDLKEGPDGLLWGVTWGKTASGTTVYSVFAMDAASQVIEKSKLLYPNTPSGSTWRPYFLRFGEDGLLYTTVGRTLTVIHPETMESKKIADSVNLMTLAEDGGIYYAEGSHLKKLPVALEEVALKLDTSVLTAGEQAQLTMSGTLFNGKAADLAQASINYKSSDEGIVTVSDTGSIQAIRAGQAEVQATVVLNGVTVRSNSVAVEVRENAAQLAEKLRQEFNLRMASGEILKPLESQLANSLKQTEHHLLKSQADQAIHHLEKFTRSLEDPKMNAYIVPAAKDALLLQAAKLLDILNQQLDS
ncbi:FIMAH domain-containing protein [Paenibacillus ihbetae]|uniref:Uncharacterized protein n=1 Tax=Paenibacillus ihbetae TaxID=1870820 RepID=A0A1B2DU82_9BACL|nr:Ig-like domain-containing protein [Paenibacillus ihbetae]ANY71268.1 hypothetical protein BBD41_00950 [Paenibacillus ihbetae]OOC61369.1 hypothetical protein BBD40_05395 [Paenibacillus ihbetae]